MTDLVYTGAAEEDLTQIALWIAADDPRVALRFVARIREHCAHLTSFHSWGGRAETSVQISVQSRTDRM